ncbi:hypothetical protein RSAG8_07475, partial [Rhizoctonia solani AG-8 WAC10335]
MERVHYYQEQMLPELKELEEKGIFSQPETRAILKQRTAFESALVRRVALKSDYIKYAQYEVTLEALRKKRAARLNSTDNKSSLADYCIVRRQFFILERAVRKILHLLLYMSSVMCHYGYNISSWPGRIMRDHSLANSAPALSLHPTSPSLYVIAASHELDSSLSPTGARALLQRGLRINPESVELWTEYIRMELGYCEGLRRRWKTLGIDSTSQSGEGHALDAIISGAIIRAAISSATESLPTLALLGSLQALLLSYPTELRAGLIEHLHSEFATRDTGSGPSGEDFRCGAVLLRATVDIPARSLEDGAQLPKVPPLRPLVAVAFPSKATPFPQEEQTAEFVKRMRKANEVLADASRTDLRVAELYARWVAAWVAVITENNLRLYLVLALTALATHLCKSIRHATAHPQTREDQRQNGAPSTPAPPKRKLYNSLEDVPNDFKTFIRQSSNIMILNSLTPNFARDLHSMVSRTLNWIERSHPNLKPVVSTPEPPQTSPPPPTKVLVDKAVESDPAPVPAAPPPQAPATGPSRSKPNSLPRLSRPLKSAAPRPRPQGQVRLVAHIAGKDKPFCCDGSPRWKTIPTDTFQSLSQSFRRSAPGCVPLGFHLSRKGNLVIAFTPSTPCQSLMSNLNIIKGSFELDWGTKITFDTPWSTIHLANVPTRLNSGAPVFSEADVIESVLSNPAISSLAITSQPRWLRKPDSITGPRSSVVFSFEDPNGAIARSLLKAPIYVFGAPATVKPWLPKPPIKTQTTSSGPHHPGDVMDGWVWGVNHLPNDPNVPSRADIWTTILRQSLSHKSPTLHSSLLVRQLYDSDKLSSSDRSTLVKRLVAQYRPSVLFFDLAMERESQIISTSQPSQGVEGEERPAKRRKKTESDKAATDSCAQVQVTCLEALYTAWRIIPEQNIPAALKYAKLLNQLGEEGRAEDVIRTAGGSKGLLRQEWVRVRDELKSPVVVGGKKQNSAQANEDIKLDDVEFN